MPDPSVLFDVCIIGTGAGGAPVAAALAEKGLRVAIIERGSALSSRQLQKDEFSFCRKPFLRPGGKKGIREITYGDSPLIISDHLWTAACVGGGTRVMSGFFFRMRTEDFKPETHGGSVPGATHKDWPIAYNDLAPYYDRVESDIGLTKQNPALYKGVLLPPLKAHPVSTLIDSACNDLGISTMVTPRAVLSKEVGDRGECSYSGFCGSYACLTGAKASTHETYIQQALTYPNVSLFTNHFVYRLESVGDALSWVHFFDEANIPGTLRARTYIIACGAIETARLLLNSRTAHHPGGLANRSGQIGKNLTFTIPCEVTGFFPKSVFEAPNLSPSPFIQRSTQDFCQLHDPALQYPRGGTVVFLFPHPNPIQRVLSLSYSENGSRLFGNALKQRIRDYFSYHHLQTDTFIEYLPNPQTHVTVSHSVNDYWGVPVAGISYCPHPENIKTSGVMAQNIIKIFSRIGAVGVSVNPSLYTAGELQQGTCRFGDDPKSSVLDSWCRSHDSKNLFITDGSFMCSGLPVPSTFTIMANALRVADYIYKNT
jgi:choline dehydrogenase-like flavoprotein